MSINGPSFSFSVQRYWVVIVKSTCAVSLNGDFAKGICQCWVLVRLSYFGIFWYPDPKINHFPIFIELLYGNNKFTLQHVLILTSWLLMNKTCCCVFIPTYISPGSSLFPYFSSILGISSYRCKAKGILMSPFLSLNTWVSCNTGTSFF